MANWGSESETECRKHPKEKPHPGVCPSCLRESLSRISTNHFSLSINRASCSSSSSSSSPRPMYKYFHHSSTANSPRRRRPHSRTASDVLDSIYITIRGKRCNSNYNGLKKSRSIACDPRSMSSINGRMKEGNGLNNEKRKNYKKKGGFWSKLLHLRRV